MTTEKPETLADDVCGTLMPIIVLLNKGKVINPKSAEHKAIFELVSRANGDEKKFYRHSNALPL